MSQLSDVERSESYEISRKLRKLLIVAEMAKVAIPQLYRAIADMWTFFLEYQS